MGLMDRAMGLVFGGGSGAGAIAETAAIFRENAENRAVREVELRDGALEQFAAEFRHAEKGGFDRFMDGVNRIPRPAMAVGTLGLFVAAMVDPVWFASRMEGIALVPEPLWWLLGAIVSFYFGARHQAKGQEFQRAAAKTAALLTRAGSTDSVENRALEEWRSEQ
ncbi:holin family protein [Palleronia sp.]|uniref:holin family protein n=1 Tax=Palleronia sp. TaxID=1940284 RepID=UPI0035C7C7B5